jgi:hypothetical protein
MIKKVVLLLICYMVISDDLSLSEEKHATWEPGPAVRAAQDWIPGPNEVIIYWRGVSPPLGRILLAKKGTEYCALRFTDTWLGETEYDHYTSYDFYYQGDGSGDFIKSSVVTGTGELLFPKVKTFLIFPYAKGAKTTIECGRMQFEWFYTTATRFGDAELAPTPWTSIKEVNVHDPGIKWYKQDSDRKRISVPIDQLWGKPVDEKKQPAGGVESSQTGSK